MSEWKEVKLGEVIITNAQSITKNYPYETILYLDTGSITCGKIDSFQEYSLKSAPSRAKRLVKKCDIVYSTVRPIQRHYGYILYPQDNLVVSTGFVVIETKKELADPAFIYNLLTLKDIVEMLDSIAEGSTSAYPSLKPSDIENLPILLPPLPEQRAIASVLSSLDDKIDLLHRENKTLESMAETLFRQWFVEREDLKKGKFDLWINETLGGEWGKENPEFSFSKPVYCIRGTDIADMNIGLPNRIPIRYVKKEKFQNIKPNDGDIIIEISGGTENQSTGRCIYINKDIEFLFELPLIFSNFCRLLRIKKMEYSFFVYCYLQYLYREDEYFNLENGSSGIKNLDYKALLFELEYPMPQEKLVLEFHKQVKLLFKKINQNKSQIRTLSALRDTLLPKLMSGEVRVSL